MTKGRDNAAESLGDVVERVRLRRQSGLLSVERLQGNRFEEGEVYFHSGQPTYARTGQLVGQEALHWMLSWRQVYFTFAANVRAASPDIAAVTANVGVAASGNAATSPGASLSGATRNVSPTSPALPQVSASNPDIPPVQHAVNGTWGTPGLEWLIPQKPGKDQDVLSLPLTRPQRSIYLLVDGRRTVSDLARCTRKSLQEIERLLSELQERGLISI